MSQNRDMARRPWGHVFQPPGRPGWYVAFTAEGRKVKRSGGRTEAAARKRLEKARQYLEDGASLADVLAHVFGDFNGASLTLRTAAPLYLDYAKGRKRPSTLRGDVGRLRVLCRSAWSAKVLGRVEPRDLLAWVAEREREGVSGATINRDLALVSALYRWAGKAGHVPADLNPARRVDRHSEKGRERETYLTAAEAGALIEACSDVARPFVLAALHTGARRGELLALRWRAVDLARREVVIEPQTEKAGRGRVVPLSPALASALADLSTRRARPVVDGSDHVFADRDGEPFHEPLVRSLLASAVRRCEAIPQAKRPKVTCHALRHTAASLMVGAGVPLFDVAKVLGHATLAVTMRYAHFAPEAGRAAIERLGSVLGGVPPSTATARG